jgi:hypothetical protein
VSVRVYGREERWPTHQRAYWHAPLDSARAAGWTLKHLDAPHRFGVVYCPSEECSFDVDKTARNAETKAKEASKKIWNCPHGSELASDAEVRRERCRRLLGSAVHLADLAEAEMDAVATYQAVVAEVELLLASAETTLDEVFREQQDDLLERIDGLDRPPSASVIAGHIDEAEQVTEQAVQLLPRRSRATAVTSLYEQATQIRTRIAGLRRRLEAL